VRGVLSVLVLSGVILPPWYDADDVPIPTWARSVAPRKPEVAIYAGPGKLDARRGSVLPGARLPLFGAKRANGCSGRWLEVGPLAWVCSDVAEMSPDERLVPPIARSDDGLPFRYYFAGRDGAAAFLSLERALDDAPDYELDPGFGTAAVEEKVAHGERWIKTRRGRWIAARELGAAHPTAFHGEEIHGELDVAWVVTDRANVYSASKPEKPVDTRVRLQVVHVKEQLGAMARISEDGEPGRWMNAKDLVRPAASPPPAEMDPDERWIEVDLATQTLVAYEGARPVYATLVSTGVGPRGSDTATPPGVHRIWAKLLTTNMDNLEREDAEKHYSIEDVPWVMFFDKAVALHGAFWHRDFGRVHSHGCVNLPPIDARWVFEFTSPHLPPAWSAAFPTRLERGTLVRVR
jgi:lipoprotein-anchoring transpeptidase ErfK/SrfK